MAFFWFSLLKWFHSQYLLPRVKRHLACLLRTVDLSLSSWGKETRVRNIRRATS